MPMAWVHVMEYSVAPSVFKGSLVSACIRSTGLNGVQYRRRRIGFAIRSWVHRTVAHARYSQAKRDSTLLVESRGHVHLFAPEFRSTAQSNRGSESIG